MAACMLQEWDAEFLDEEDESLQEEFGAALDESIAQRLSEAGLDDTEVCCPSCPGSTQLVLPLFSAQRSCMCTLCGLCVLQTGLWRVGGGRGRRG